MKIFKGEKGLEASWQEPFEPSVKCKRRGCKGNCRIMFVAFEGPGTGDKKGQFVCDLHDNMKDKKYWPHDAIAVAVYLCEKCFEAVAEINQA